MIQELLERVFPRMNDRNSRQDVKNRLRLVLAHDRADLNPELIEAIRRDILEVLSRYVDLDADTMEMTLENNNRMTALVANLPIRRVKAEFYTVKESPTETLPELPLDESAIGDPKLGVGLAAVSPSQVQRSQSEMSAEPIAIVTPEALSENLSEPAAVAQTDLAPGNATETAAETAAETVTETATETAIETAAETVATHRPENAAESELPS